jgi:hypothetical protein
MAKVSIISSAAATGSRVIPSEEIDRAFDMPVGKLRGRAGIESLAYAAEGETNLFLAQGRQKRRCALVHAERKN